MGSARFRAPGKAPRAVLERENGVKKGLKRNIPASPSGNRTPVSRVTGGDTHHYTNEDGHGKNLQALHCKDTVAASPGPVLPALELGAELS